MLLAMVMSLGVMQGINANSEDSNLQQIGSAMTAAGSRAENDFDKIGSLTVGSAIQGMGYGLLLAGFVNPPLWVGAVLFIY